MANVDQCVRQCELAMSGNIKNISNIIYEMKESNKVQIFRGKDRDFIECLLLRTKQDIQKVIRNRFYDNKINSNSILLEQSSNNNKIGADLFHKTEEGQIIDIEIKFGNETNKQIGMDVFKSIFGVDYFSKSLSVETRKKWYQNIKNNNYCCDNQEALLMYELNKSIDLFNKHFFEKKQLSENGKIALENTIINCSGSKKESKNIYLKFKVSSSKTELVSAFKIKEGNWQVDQVKQINEKVKRVNVFVFNDKTHIKIKFVLNWKNSYKKDGYRFDAKLGLGSPSWNVWVSNSLKS